jgi:hypothetical protein
MPAMVTLPRSGIIFMSGKLKSLLKTIDFGYNTKLLRGDTEVRGVKKMNQKLFFKIKFYGG